MKTGRQTFGASFSVPETIFVLLTKRGLLHSVYMLTAPAYVLYGAVEKIRVLAGTTHKDRATASASF